MCCVRLVCENQRCVKLALKKRVNVILPSAGCKSVLQQDGQSC